MFSINKRYKLLLLSVYPSCVRSFSLSALEALENSERRHKKKVRQHVNPLTLTHQQPIVLDDNWISQSYMSPSRPFIVDIGCCRGRWALKYAMRNATVNLLGIDIRQPVIDIAKDYLGKQKPDNLEFICTNANVNMQRLLADINKASYIDAVTVQFPDPCFKKSHHKRRVINAAFLDILAQYLQPQARVFVQSDVASLMEHMVDVFANNRYFNVGNGYSIDTLDKNVSIFDIPTERERQCLVAGESVYRMLYSRNNNLSTDKGSK